MNPQLLAHQGQSIREGRVALAVPSCLSDCLRVLGHMLVSEQRDHGEQSQQCRSSPLDCSLGPMPLSFKSQALTYFLKGGLHLPAPHKPGDDPLRVSSTKIGAKERLGPELSLGVSDQHPTQRHGGQARAVPNSGSRDGLYGAFLLAIPVGHRDGLPDSGRIFSNAREVRQPLTLEARPSHLAGVAWWSRLVRAASKRNRVMKVIGFLKRRQQSSSLSEA